MITRIMFDTYLRSIGSPRIHIALRLHPRRVCTGKAEPKAIFLRRQKAFDATYLVVLWDSRLRVDAAGKDGVLWESFRSFLLKFVV